LREQGIHLIELNVTEFPHNGRKRLRAARAARGFECASPAAC
jgi:hypothetical protein